MSKQYPIQNCAGRKRDYFNKEIIELTHEGAPADIVIVLKNITPFKELDVAKQISLPQFPMN